MGGEGGIGWRAVLEVEVEMPVHLIERKLVGQQEGGPRRESIKPVTLII